MVAAPSGLNLGVVGEGLAIATVQPSPVFLERGAGVRKRLVGVGEKVCSGAAGSPVSGRNTGTGVAPLDRYPAARSRVPNRASAAQALGLSPRTLARRMQSQQLDFSTLVDQARRDAALHAVASTTRALADIGQSLGFAEPSTFWRAFRRWTGQTPAQWRRQNLVNTRDS